MEKRVLANTVALVTSISVTVLPSAVCVGGGEDNVCIEWAYLTFRILLSTDDRNVQYISGLHLRERRSTL